MLVAVFVIITILISIITINIIMPPSYLRDSKNVVDLGTLECELLA